MALDDYIGGYATLVTPQQDSLPAIPSDSFSPLLLNDDGSVSCAGVTLPVAYDGSTDSITVAASTPLNDFTISGRLAFCMQAGQAAFSGDLIVNDVGPYALSGAEVVPFADPTLTTSIAANQAFDSGDNIQLVGSNGMWVVVETDGSVGATSEYPPSYFFTVETNSSGIIISYDGEYWCGTSGPITTTNVSTDATPFVVRTSLDGKCVLGVGSTDYLTVAAGGSLQISTESTLATDMEFDIHMQPVAPNVLLARWGVQMPFDGTPTPCQLDVAALAWQVTGGLILALGTIPMMMTGTRQVGFLAVLRLNPRVAAAVDRATAFAKANPRASAVAIAGQGVMILQAAYQVGMIWQVIKFALMSAGWWVLFRIVAWVVTTFCTAGAAATAQLAVSLAIWFGMTVNVIVNLVRDCSGPLDQVFVRPKQLPAPA